VTALPAFLRRDVLATTSYRTAVAFDLAWGSIQVFLYFFISRVVGLSPSADLGKAPTYFAFALAGILMSLIVSSGASEIASRLRDEQLTGTLELLVAQPIRGGTLALATAGFPFAYALGRVVLYLAIAIGALSLSTSHTSWIGVAVMLVAAGFAFLGLGIAAAAVTLIFKRAAVIDVAIFGMTFVSGALFPLSVLPSWLRPLGHVMPTKPAFDGLRAALFGSGGWGEDALILAGVAIVVLPLAIWAFEAAINHAKRKGTLAQY
jgi:ABC-type multidrug transport system permease subunit